MSRRCPTCGTQRGFLARGPGVLAPSFMLGGMTLTPKQIDFLKLAMQDYLDVSRDALVRRHAKAIKAKLDNLGFSSTRLKENS